MIDSVLVTNDDGWESPGLWSLARAIKPFARHVTVVAPKFNQSAVSSGFTLRRELSWERIEKPPVEGVEAWHVDGTPADCVMVALTKLLHRPLDFALSGINRGANIGNDILASGTVGGALAAHIRGVPAMAVSLAVNDKDEPNWETAEKIACLLCKEQCERPLPETSVLNVNVPSIPYADLTGILVTRMGPVGFVKLEEKGGQSVVLQRDHDAHTNPNSPPGTDGWAIAHRYVSVTPLQANLTEYRAIDILSGRLNAAFHAAEEQAS